MTKRAAWPAFTGDHKKPRPLGALPPAPPWRGIPTEFDRTLAPRSLSDGTAEMDPRHRRTFQADEIAVINAAIFLRRPLLVEGSPGSGKSSIAYAIAHELALGPVLKWEIGSRTTLKDGLYRYDALARLHDARGDEPIPVDDYITLGPLGTALYPHSRPRVLLVDELDKGDLDLPNDLLHVLEDGAYELEEIQRAKGEHFAVRLADDKEKRYPIPSHGRIHCGPNHPILIITSNRERDFSPVFLRRCLRLETRVPSQEEQLEQIIRTHLGDHKQAADELVRKFAADVRAGKKVATDQLLNAVYLSMHRGQGAPADLEKVLAAVLRPLDS
jgi:MoxR-like ATPase